MPKIYRFNSLLLSDEVYTITEDEAVAKTKPLMPEYEESNDPDGFSETFAEDSEKDEISPSLSASEARGVIQKAKEEAALIVNQANLQAKMDHDRLLAQTVSELEDIKRQAYEEAFEHGRIDGAKSQSEEILQCIKDMEDSVSHLEGEQAGFMAEYEYNLKWLAWEIASKVLGHKIEQDETEMLSLVKTAIASVKNAAWISVEVSEQMTGLIDQLTHDLKKSGDEHVDIRGADLPAGACIVDAPDGLIDASVYSQLENLRIYFAQEEA